MTFLSRMQPSPAPIAPRRLPEVPTQGPANRPAQRPAVGRPGDGFEVRGGRAGPAGVGGHAAPAGGPTGIASGGVSGSPGQGPVAGGPGSDGPGSLGLEGGAAGQARPDAVAVGGVGGTAQPPSAMEQLLQSARDNVPGFTWLESKTAPTCRRKKGGLRWQEPRGTPRNSWRLQTARVFHSLSILQAETDSTVCSPKELSTLLSWRAFLPD